MSNKLLTLQTNTFVVNVEHSDNCNNNFTAVLKNGTLQITIPYNIDLTKETNFTKTTLPNIIEHFLKIEAERHLHQRLKDISNKCGLNYATSKIFISKKSTQGKRYKSRSITFGAYYTNSRIIKLNAFLMLMPDDCIEEVLTHELCHSKYQDHSPRFYNLLASIFPNYKKTSTLRKEYVSLIFDYFR